MTLSSATRDAVLRIGEVVAVEGRRIDVLVDKNKNLSYMFLDGEIIVNIGVGSYLAITKGFLSIVGRVEGERIQEDLSFNGAADRRSASRIKRILTVAATGHIDERGRFHGGMRELPLLGNEAFLLTSYQLRLVHDLVRADVPSISIAKLDGGDIDVRLPIDGLFNSHIAIFGNTGSGKSNTLAALYQELLATLRARNPVRYRNNTRFVLCDFNGEYVGASCLTQDKRLYGLSTRRGNADRLPIKKDEFLDIEVLSVLADATEKTQKPFIARTVKLFRRIEAAEHSADYYRGVLRQLVQRTLQMTDKVRAHLLLDYFRQILPETDANGAEVEIDADLSWHNGQSLFMRMPGQIRLSEQSADIVNTVLYRHVVNARWGDSFLADLVGLLYVQLIADVLANRAQNEHIAPVIHRLNRKRDDIERLFEITEVREFWLSNVVIINLEDVNLEMRKTIPLLLAKMLYREQKQAPDDRTLTLIVDEAHNILSTESFREAESWKDYRLETFEEIIKEGRKFGVFMTIASQRPNDISPTITSQAHNYFIHRLVNDYDLQTIASAVSYIDRPTKESIPTLPTGTCVFSGVVTAVPLKLNVRALADIHRPQSATRSYGAIVTAAG